MSSEALVRFWGTRGSIPTPGALTDKYGGNTTCLEVTLDQTHLIFDAGSGIRELGRTWLENAEPVRAPHLLFTHMHWDHIQGFPFFAPAYLESTSLTIYGADYEEGSTEEILNAQMGGVYFPVPLSAMRGERHFRATTPLFHIDDVEVRTMQLPHPGGCLAYRVTAGDRVFILATDCELDLAAQNRDELQNDHLTRRRYTPELLEFFESADLLVIDLQYTDEEYQERVGWGHNSIATVADFVAQTEPARAAFTHHDPASSDQTIADIARELADRVSDVDTRTFAAREGLAVALAH